MSWCCSCFAKTYEAPEVLELDYRHSSLTEVPPDVFTYERTLEKLDLGCNQISDLPPSLFHCHELRELDLCDNDLMCIPPAVGSLTRLARLDLSRNAIADVADTVKNCKSLTYLDLSLNHLQKLPEGISQLVNLEELFLNDTYLEFLHANFGRLTKLKVLELRENSLQTLPKSMNRLHNLQRIDIGQNDITELPEVIGTMTNLVEVWCDNNSIRTLPKFIGNLVKLNCLDASQNDILEISEEISKCGQLSDLTLASNTLESLPDSFPKLENLTVLRLDSNSIQYLPEDFGNLKNLQELSLIRNLLKTLPASVGLMRKLRTLYLDDNLLTELPKEIGSCSALSILSVAKNRLYMIPSEVGHLNNLKVLTVAGNLLVHLPVSILNITKLNALWLSESQSKPMLPLNKEIDAATGQHVLTCYLLPQMPSTQMTETDTTTDNEEQMPPRRSRPSIKFLTDAEPQPTDNNLSKRGLLRAPTPYPKELRALAKHASHLRSKDQNGDVVINDEPEYEGDYLVGDEDGQEVKIEDLRKNPLNGDLFYGPQPQQPVLPAKDYIQNDSVANNNASERSYSSNITGPQVPLLPVENILSSIELTNKRSGENIHHFPTQTNISLIEPYPSVTSSEETPFLKHDTDTATNKKGPPPYHVAARRAAFFRSSTPSTSPVGPSSPLSISPSRKSPVFPLKAEALNGKSMGGQDFHLKSSLNIPTTASSNTSGDNHSRETTSEVFNESKVAFQNQQDENKVKFEPRHFLPPPTEPLNMKPDGMWNTILQTTPMTERVSIPSDNESRIIEEIIDASKIHAGQREMVDVVSSTGIKKKYELNDNHVTQVQNFETIIKKITNTTTVDELRKSDLISTIELSLKHGQEDHGNRGQDEIHPNWESRHVGTAPGFSKSTIQHSGNNTDASNNNSSSRLTTDYNKVESPDTGLSSSESFSRIPVLSPSKISAVPTVGDGPKVPQKQMQVLSKLPQISSTSSVISVSKNKNVSDHSANININWTRIPKGPGHTNNADIAAIVNTDAPAGHTDIPAASKPTLIKTLSGSRIPGISGSESKISKSTQHNVTPASLHFNKGASNPTMQALVHPITSPTGSSRIPRFGENHSSPPVEQQSQHLESANKLERTLSGSRIPKFNEGVRLTGFPDSQLHKISNKPETPSNVSEPTAQANSGNSPISKIPTVATRKPWIFGTHRNARVVPVEYIKVNTLGFTVTDGPMGSNAGDGNGIYVDTIETQDSTVKVGDKILQVDGIDVSNMGVDIVRKILGNCQENIHLLVSRHY
ncbi:unnamed protein product [Allacma fusca]|uniref:PDZ domain-containing protein n=1 Tax=Allacma fusca TaxID=39272 RepID=A0A8J2JCC4_9HEXA|nr:unnamed protein product [Allacma fusca]